MILKETFITLSIFFFFNLTLKTEEIDKVIKIIELSTLDKLIDCDDVETPVVENADTRD